MDDRSAANPAARTVARDSRGLVCRVDPVHEHRGARHHRPCGPARRSGAQREGRRVYLGGSSLAQQADQVIPHAIYLAVWTASAVLILLGGARLRLGALLSLGLSVVTFGLFFADAGTAIAATGNAAGAGLVLALIGWLACAAGSVVAFLVRPASAPAGQPG